jgi:hypothetical protein
MDVEERERELGTNGEHAGNGRQGIEEEVHHYGRTA